MKSYVLMSRKTGHLFEGFCVWFEDDTMSDIAPLGWTILAKAEFDGWVVRNPLPESGFGDFAVFFNRDGVKRLFENLGEL